MMDEKIDFESDNRIYDDDFCNQYFEVFTDSEKVKKIFITKQNYKDFYLALLNNFSFKCTDYYSLLEYTLDYLGVDLCEIMVDTINSLESDNEINYTDLADKWIEDHLSEITTVYSFCMQ